MYSMFFACLAGFFTKFPVEKMCLKSFIYIIALTVSVTLSYVSSYYCITVLYQYIEVALMYVAIIMPMSLAPPLKASFFALQALCQPLATLLTMWCQLKSPPVVLNSTGSREE